jgi:CubicO group peptidase (beta-lactamase class C family)
MPVAATFAQLANSAGYRADEPLLIVARRGGAHARLARGWLPPGAGAPGLRPVTVATPVYAASLAKQVTAACAALLASAGVLDMQAPLARYVPDAPPWSTAVRLRHLVHHTSGLPLDGPPSGPERTTAAVLDAARAGPRFPPGTRFAYSNVGYVLLAEATAAAAGEPFADVARRLVFAPLGMADTMFWSGPGAAPPGAAPLDPADPAPLSLGDGGMWSTGEDLLRWCDGLDDDRLGVTGLLQTPGRLDDGTPLHYAWGMAVRSIAGNRVYRHGGGYSDVRAMLARAPDVGLDLVIVALADRTERTAALADAVLERSVRDGSGKRLRVQH